MIGKNDLIYLLCLIYRYLFLKIDDKDSLSKSIDYDCTICSMYLFNYLRYFI